MNNFQVKELETWPSHSTIHMALAKSLHLLKSSINERECYPRHVRPEYTQGGSIVKPSPTKSSVIQHVKQICVMYPRPLLWFLLANTDLLSSSRLEWVVDHNWLVQRQVVSRWTESTPLEEGVLLHIATLHMKREAGSSSEYCSICSTGSVKPTFLLKWWAHPWVGVCA